MKAWIPVSLLSIIAGSVVPAFGLDQVSPDLHRLCRDAKDYKGCIEANNATNNNATKAVNGAKSSNQQASKEIQECSESLRKALRSHSSWVKYASQEEKVPLVCALIISSQSRLAKEGVEKKKSEAAISVCTAHFIFNGQQSDFTENTCSCTAKTLNLNTALSQDAAVRLCASRFRTQEVAGFRLVSDKEGLRFGFREGSVRQASVRGTYGRYISFVGRSLNAYSGTPSTFVPGQPGYVDCSYGGGGNLLGWSSGGSCYGQTATESVVIPGEPGGTQGGVFEYLLDCKDKTFDRKGDLSSASGMKKGWMDISEDPVAAYVEYSYCPSIDILPRSEVQMSR